MQFVYSAMYDRPIYTYLALLSALWVAYGE